MKAKCTNVKTYAIEQDFTEKALFSRCEHEHANTVKPATHAGDVACPGDTP